MKYDWTKRDMAEFEKQYPDAYAFLNSRSLMNEYRHLATNTIILNEWQKNRMMELETICGYNLEMVTKMNVADIFYDQNN